MFTTAALPDASRCVIGCPHPYTPVPMVALVPHRRLVSPSPTVLPGPTHTRMPSLLRANSAARAVASAGSSLASFRKRKPYIAPSVSPAQRKAIVFVVKQERLNSVILLRDRSATRPMRHVNVGRRTSCASSVASYVLDRKSTRLNSSHGYISYAVFCLKKKKKKKN